MHFDNVECGIINANQISNIIIKSTKLSQFSGNQAGSFILSGKSTLNIQDSILNKITSKLLGFEIKNSDSVIMKNFTMSETTAAAIEVSKF